MTTARRIAVAKTLFFRTEPRYLYDFYEPLDLLNSDSRRRYASADYSTIAALNKYVLIAGTGGSGKSTFLKHVFLSCLKATDVLPIIIEARHLATFDGDFLSFISQTLSIRNKARSSVFVKAALSTGRIAVLLDGIDEVDPQKLPRIQKDVLSLSSQYPETQWIVTSRPMEIFTSWNQFLELKCAPLTLDKAESIVRKLGVDPDLEDRFCKALRRKYFDTHKHFLSNPLLLLIMLLTYQDVADIPESLHEFYEHAINALLHRHDASKGGYRRQTQTRLDHTSFKAACAGFCTLSYHRRQTEFGPEALETTLDESKALSGIEYDSTRMISDLTTAACILARDGTTYQFSHRSFQEYFTAYFLNKATMERKERLIKTLCVRGARQDAVLDMLFGMNRPLVEKLVIQPHLAEIRKRCKFRGRIYRTTIARFISWICDIVGVDFLPTVDDDGDEVAEDGTFFKIRPTQDSRWALCHFVFRHYGFDSYRVRVGSASTRK
jgi:predicted NACHT family NTPase